MEDWLQSHGISKIVYYVVISLGSLFMAWPKINGRIHKFIEHLKMKRTERLELKHIVMTLQENLDQKFYKLQTGIDYANESIHQVSARQVSDDYANSSAGIFETDRQGNFRYINPEFSRISGMQESEAKGNGWINIIAPELRKEVSMEWQDAILNSRNFSVDTFIIKGSQRLKTRIQAVIMKGPNEQIIGFRGRLIRMT